ncbi:hypothetical protein KO527_25325 [Pseudoalteromonas sp. C2R02]|uniref:hypothetical protein n=1 Tax=Pseudoalteromonas sp. C2R02 TaxID=2841565 RepID=UPI001C09965B|nr:hypothetical protein [Pseudoalteromonas sp. C2R02]MBU2972662.1 hypothetical protein [Pseudoalteromonas sp. C2R02]
MNKRLLFKLLIFILFTINTGCYSNWHDLNTFVDKISCETTKEKVIEHTRLNLIEYEWDQDNRVLSIYKNSDAVAITFNKQDKLQRIAISKSDIKLLGLFRKQSTPTTHLACKN